MKTINPRRCLYQFHWLNLRASMSFVDPLRAAQSLAELRRYLPTGPEWDPEFNRIYRVMTLLNETMETLEKHQRKNKEVIRLVEELQTEVANRYAQIQTYAGPIVLTEAEQVREIRALWDSGHGNTVHTVKLDLQHRLAIAQDPITAEEIGTYLRLIDQVMGTDPFESPSNGGLAAAGANR